MRNWGIAVEASSLPAWVHQVASVVTTAGDPLVVLGTATLLFWVGPRVSRLDSQTGARIAAVTLAGVALIAPAKVFLAAPRPPPEVAVIATDGYGLPSGHTTGATSLATALVLLLDQLSTRSRLTLASLYVTGIASSRVLLGVHYVGDVLLGFVAGVACGTVAVYISRETVTPAFVLAALFGMVGVFLTVSTQAMPMIVDVARGAGGTGGALLAWLALNKMDAPIAPPSNTTLIGGAMIAILGLLMGVTEIPVLTAIGAAVTGATVVSVPRSTGLPGRDS